MVERQLPFHKSAAIGAVAGGASTQLAVLLWGWKRIPMKNKSTRASRSRTRSGDYADERYRKEALRILATFGKAKPDNGKKWISHEDHDRVLYGERP
jgi:hypothetical protein